MEYTNIYTEWIFSLSLTYTHHTTPQHREAFKRTKAMVNVIPRHTEKNQYMLPKSTVYKVSLWIG